MSTFYSLIVSSSLIVLSLLYFVFVFVESPQPTLNRKSAFHDFWSDMMKIDIKDRSASETAPVVFVTKENNLQEMTLRSFDESLMIKEPKDNVVDLEIDITPDQNIGEFEFLLPNEQRVFSQNVVFNGRKVLTMRFKPGSVPDYVDFRPASDSARIISVRLDGISVWNSVIVHDFVNVYYVNADLKSGRINSVTDAVRHSEVRTDGRVKSMLSDDGQRKLFYRIFLTV